MPIQKGSTDWVMEELYELLLVDLLDDLVRTGDIDPNRAGLIKACHFMDKYLKLEELKNDFYKKKNKVL